MSEDHKGPSLVEKAYPILFQYELIGAYLEKKLQEQNERWMEQHTIFKIVARKNKNE